MRRRISIDSFDLRKNTVKGRLKIATFERTKFAPLKRIRNALPKCDSTLLDTNKFFAFCFRWEFVYLTFARRNGKDG